jgi:hypothetical protein
VHGVDDFLLEFLSSGFSSSSGGGSGILKKCEFISLGIRVGFDEARCISGNSSCGAFSGVNERVFP